MLGFFYGVIAASVVWFFVWRNNKKFFVEKLNNVDRVVSAFEDTEIGKAIKSHIYVANKKL